VRDERRAEALAAVRAMQRALIADWPGLQARLLTRADANGAQTWMEAYARVDGTPSGPGIDEAVADAIEAAAQSLLAFIDGGRHAESFEIDDPASVPTARG
jgi:hypothetical protein